MVGSDNKVKQDKHPTRDIPSSKKITSRTIPYRKDVNAYYEETPSWSFSMLDLNGAWPLNSTYCGNLWWDEIIPRLQSWESMKWKDIFMDKANHSIDVNDLNSVAKRRLDEISIEAEDIVSLRIQATHRLYGLIQDRTFFVIWFDKNHGDNKDCVCRSKKKHT